MFIALRIVLGIVAALATAFILLIAVEGFSTVVHPVPADFQGTQDEMCAHVARYPAWVLGAVVPMWGFIAFASVWIAGRIGNRWGGLFVGVLLFAGAASNLAMLPYPLWFEVVMPIALLIAVGLGFLAVRRKPVPATASPPADEASPVG